MTRWFVGFSVGLSPMKPGLTRSPLLPPAKSIRCLVEPFARSSKGSSAVGGNPLSCTGLSRASGIPFKGGSRPTAYGSI